jgi:rRNA maturation RNase YbeY
MQFPDLDAPDALQYPIDFFFEDVAFDLPDPEKLRSWLLSVAVAEGKQISETNYIFCSDEHLHGINIAFLGHDYYTDIITFDYSEGGNLQGEMYISSERVSDNARAHGVTFDHELCRVMVHGILHMAGYSDKSAGATKEMRAKEDFYLAQCGLF